MDNTSRVSSAMTTPETPATEEDSGVVILGSEAVSAANVEALAEGAVASAIAAAADAVLAPPLTPSTTDEIATVATPKGDHIGLDGKPLYLTDNVKGASGQNKWMWNMAQLIMPNKDENKSGACLGAWCLRCEQLGKTPKECHLNYHPTRNFKAISRHFNRYHSDLKAEQQQDTPVMIKHVSNDNDRMDTPVSPATRKKTAKKIPTAVAGSASSKRCAHEVVTADSPASPPSKRSRDDDSMGPVDVPAAIPPPPLDPTIVYQSQLQQHKIISPPTIHPCGDGRRVVVTEHVLSLPLYRSVTVLDGEEERIDVYFCLVETVSSSNRAGLEGLGALSPTERAAEYVRMAGLTNADGMMLYLQGGPGFGSPAPFVGLGLEKNSSWAAKALETYSHIVLLDQRGTGRSSAITKQSLEKKFPDLFCLDGIEGAKIMTLDDLGANNPAECEKVREAIPKTTYFMSQFRADSIVLDAEDIKNALLLPIVRLAPHPWGCVLGQSFGGFCLSTYLSKVDLPPKVCLFTGGIPPMLTPVAEVYNSLWQRVKDRSRRYYEMYPDDVRLVKAIVRKLLKQPAALPSGGTLTARRFLQLGLGLGVAASFPKLHSMLSGACLATCQEGEIELKRSFLKAIDSEQSFDDAPIYFWLHESIYADGPERSNTGWAACQSYESIVKKDPGFDFELTSALDDDSMPTLFFGEMVFPWMSEDYAELSGVGLRSMAEQLACKADWPEMYDGEKIQRALVDGSSKAAATVYHGDMYVDFDSCMKVVAPGSGPLEKCKVWITNEYQHSGLRDDGARIFSRLHGMATGSVNIPS